METYLLFRAVTCTPGRHTHHHHHHGNRIAICDVSTIRSTYSRASLLSSIAFYRSSVSSHRQGDAVCYTCLFPFVHLRHYMSAYDLCVCVCVLYWLISVDYFFQLIIASYTYCNNEQVNLCSCAWPKFKMTLSHLNSDQWHSSDLSGQNTQRTIDTNPVSATSQVSSSRRCQRHLICSVSVWIVWAMCWN